MGTGVGIAEVFVVDASLGVSVGEDEVFVVGETTAWDGTLPESSSHRDKSLVISVEITLAKLSFWCKQLIKSRWPPEANANEFDITEVIASSGMDWFDRILSQCFTWICSAKYPVPNTLSASESYTRNVSRKVH